MSSFTIVTTSATRDADEAEVSTLSAEFLNESEALGYSRRMAEEMLGLADQLALDFDYSNVALYDGDLIDVELDTDHPALMGVWVLDETEAGFVTAQEFREGPTEPDED